MSQFSASGAEPRPIRDASSLVLLREGHGAAAADFEVLLVRRNRGAAFMADAFVVPGGRVDESDGGDFRMAAAREAFEEAGVLLASDTGGAWVRTEGEAWVEPARGAILDGSQRLSDVLAGRGLTVTCDALVLFARWITPPNEARRFDARFFLARMPPGQDARPDTAEEVVEFRWGTPRVFLDEQRAGKIQLPPPTIWHLASLAQRGSIDSAFEFAREQERTIAPVRPKLASLGGVVAVVFPWDSEYARAEGPVDPEGEPMAKDHPVAAHLSSEISRCELHDGLWIVKGL